LLTLFAAFSLALATPELPKLPPIVRAPQITYLDAAGNVIGVRGGQWAPPIDNRPSAQLRAGRLCRHRGPPLLRP